jgi:hypothetical protein
LPVLKGGSVVRDCKKKRAAPAGATPIVERIVEG